MTEYKAGDSDTLRTAAVDFLIQVRNDLAFDEVPTDEDIENQIEKWRKET